MKTIVLIISTLIFCSAGIVLTPPEKNEKSGHDYMVLDFSDNELPVQIATSKEEQIAYLGRKDGRIYPKNHKFYYWDRTRRKMLNVVEESSGKKR
ncbi:hypothetical protein GCK72_017295 [Caenorhabditis remanei]|uniref:Uncharacterized protein n=1 Tax=Caenorhabditis remanei TaxID=31234 RepID=A0A6A5G853_CAERE|nr:hypothetical protein GCK72_017295 [Caenorhabditis remanei]KAF1750744.1 hypothetical protein GCK72_017295 [Caenorhabditis remanei]